MLTKEELLVAKFNELLEDNNIGELRQKLPKLLKTFIKNSSRMEKILKQADAQQLQVLKLTEQIEETNSKVNDLLNNAKAGFLYFDETMCIGKEYSREVVNIFLKDVANINIHELLYPDDKEKAIFFKETLQGILKETPIRQEILISLLQNEFIINNKFIQAEYKVLNEHSFMLILTDITKTKELDQKVKDEQQVLKMVVQVVTSAEQFNEITDDYYLLCGRIEEFKKVDMLNDLRREIHTFKGLFAQKEMLHIVKHLHQFENLIDSSIRSNVVDESVSKITTHDLVAWLNDDLSILKEILGDDFFKRNNYLSVDKRRIETLHDRYESIIRSYNNPLLENIAYEIKRLAYSDIRSFLKPYEKMVELLAQRLGKDIKPLVVECDEIFISDSFKPFLNSLVHIFRNCIDHGIETAERRVELDKEHEATITCIVTQNIDNLIISIGDNGKGIDTNLVREKAVARGLYSEADLSNKTDEEILQIIFEEDFSTTSSISDVSGRGVGLSSVRYELDHLGGSVEIDNQIGKGVNFKFIIPKLNIKSAELDILSRLSQRTIEYFDDTLSLVIDKDFIFKEYIEVEPQDINVVIEIEGSVNAQIVMGVSNELAITMVNNFVKLELPKSEIAFLAAENVAETLNITLGNILKDLYLVSDGDGISISTPKIILKQDMDETLKYSSMESSLKIDNEVIKLWYINEMENR